MGGTLVLVVFALIALASANGGCGSVLADGNGDFEFSETDGDVADADVDDDGDLPTCDGVVVVEAASGSARVPADTGSLDGSSSTTCGMQPGRGGEEAVRVLQTALARCHDQAVAVDGEYGPDTERAVMAVQRQAGIDVDGEYGPVTLQAMRWPTTETSGATDCVAGTSPAGDERSSLPVTR
jgi:peptidoglycan hydrolase-like protein with peptidoglycan-binding domain